ncbi:hypothetical protein FJ872_27410 [Mesorhizobium sp. B2-5-9]|uniref:hypothetical protein n=1 Tax=Mesorhizobium sp. B2-5-9 TaxID=2589921 RepID=UPI00112DB75E|nr:hypothetical protein [Mesorhizobium sp. B2-5-9]TPK04591.1 hypothetical protein FJ872_27410 [Mesorhizobium sp. B2-5-9]
MKTAVEKTTFGDLEALICDADNMLDVLLDMMERDFATTGPVDIDRGEADRLFFVVSQAALLSANMKRAYYKALDDQKGGAT